MNAASPSGVARKAQSSAPLRMLARLGFAVNGLLHILIGFLAISVVFGAAGGSADQSGALAQLAATPGGAFLLWTVVVGLFALGLWLLISAFLVHGDPKHKWGQRAANIGKAAAYFFLAATSVTFAQGGATSSASSTSDASAKLLSSPGGVFILFVAGLLVLAIGGYFVYKGAAKKFTADLAMPSGPAGQAVITLGVVGYIAKGIVLGVVAVLILVAALTLDPSKSSGLDGSLKTLAGLPFGSIILVAIGIGLIAYGVYCVARAWRARL
ncbi:DUF1206 domain-containing protein [Cryobacterium sp. N21]|uniref:DUF1206 domain-containing protein n=1 Tax=Cryobacterium sp. N21 TaxID=2048289 RepID=UPI001E33F903|nr:DUF1206 domain-containing protein [Cryobacterium sp. N21]